MKKIILALLAGLLSVQLFGAYTLETTSTADANGFAKCGEKVTLTAQAFENGKPLDDSLTLQTHIWQDGKKSRRLKTPASEKVSITLVLDQPGRAYIKCVLKDPKDPKRVIKIQNPINPKRTSTSGGIGFYADPHRHRIHRQEPADFDKFWDAQKAGLAKVPLKVLEKKPISVPEKYAADFECYDVKIACSGPAPVSGILTLPKNKSRRYPAMVRYHGAGVVSASRKFIPGLIVFDVNAHGLPNLMPKKFYTGIRADKNRDPYSQSAEKRFEMFCNMFIRAIRALEYVRTLPEWNSQDLAVSGGSQGGLQTLAAAALDKKVTLAIPTIPAMVGSAEFTLRKNVEPAWPNPYTQEFRRGDDVTAIAKKFDYIDGAFFMRRITCPIHISVGLIDYHAAHVYAAFNACPSTGKTITCIPRMGHLSYNPAGDKALNAVIAKQP